MYHTYPMKLHLEHTSGINLIRSWDESGIVINDSRHTLSLILSAERVTEDWPVHRTDELCEDACLAIIEHNAEIVLLGTGLRHQLVEPRYFAWFAERGMGLEVMDTGAACRTYNVLAGERRRVAAALILDQPMD
jgi:uncharacterized protein